MAEPLAAAQSPPENLSSAAQDVIARYQQARARRRSWEPLWQDCYDFALPQHDMLGGAGLRRAQRLYDGTAPDAVDQLAAGLMAQLAPAGARWFALEPGDALSDARRDALAPYLERANRILHAHVERSGFAVELHQALLDLVTAGTGAMMLEPALPGAASALRFKALPLAEIALEEGPDGRPSEIWRRAAISPAELLARFPEAELPPALRRLADDPGARVTLIEGVLPDRQAWSWVAVLEDHGPLLLARRRLERSPVIAFRWMKSPGEVYGRSPVMKALPDIKTANKVVELILKNASIAVTGIWQADDDGVLNPANIRLTPGAIIPKAVGSAGLRPLEMPARFDVSQLMLDQLRARIRHALMVDSLGQVSDPRMTATEVLERSAEMGRLMAATFGRLQAELLVPLIHRAAEILQDRGEIPDLPLDGRNVAIRLLSPLARAQARQEAQATLNWVRTAASLGPEAMAPIDTPQLIRWLGQQLGVPAELMRAQPGAVEAATEAVDALATALHEPAPHGPPLSNQPTKEF